MNQKLCFGVRSIKTIGWGCLGFVSGGFIYIQIHQLYNKYMYNINFNRNIKLNQTINLGGYLGGLIGLLRGYYGMSIVELLSKKIKKID